MTRGFVAATGSKAVSEPCGERNRVREGVRVLDSVSGVQPRLAYEVGCQAIVYNGRRTWQGGNWRRLYGGVRGMHFKGGTRHTFGLDQDETSEHEAVVDEVKLGGPSISGGSA